MPLPLVNSLLFRLLALIVLFGPVASAASSGGNDSLLVKPGQRVVFLGDSTTQNGWTSASGFIHLVTFGLARENVQITPTQLGTHDIRPQELLELYREKVATMTPKADWLVVSCGLDVLLRSLPDADVATFQENLKTLVEEAKKAGLQVMILTTSIPNERNGKINRKFPPYNDALRVLARSENCALADIDAVENTALPTLPVQQGGQKILIGEPTLNSHGQRLVASEILKAFGVNAAQLTEIQEAWLDMPNSATGASNVIHLGGSAPLTLREYDTLEALAAGQKKSLTDIFSAKYMAAVIAALRSADASSDSSAIQNAAQASYKKDIADLVKSASPATAFSTPPASTNSAPPTTDGILVKSGEKIAFLGDSITQYGWQHPYGYVHLVIRGLATVGVQAAPVPAGISGNTSKDMLLRLQASVLDQKPDWMTLSCGVNDVWHGLTGCDLETYKKNITSIVDQAQNANIKVVILTATMIHEEDNPLNQKLAAYNDFLRELAAKRKFPLADLNASEREALKAIPADAPYQHLTVDGVHMNPHGDQMMALGVLKALGLTDAQLAQVKEHWLDEPDGASANAEVALSGSTEITLRETDALEQQAIANKKLLTDYLTPIYIETLIAQAKTDTAQTDLAALQSAAVKSFAQKISDLAKNPPPLPAPTPAPEPAK